MRPPLPTVAALVALLGAPAQAGAQLVSCEDLRTRIEGRIRGNGVQGFAVVVIDATAKAPGQVVGSCEGGAKKLHYVRGPAAEGDTGRPATAASAAAPARKQPAPVITECADGRVITSGNCKTP